MKILFNDLASQWKEIKDNCAPSLEKLLDSGMYIGGEALEEFEEAFACYTGRKYAAGVSNGTDGLKLAIQSFEFYKDSTDVIMPANGYIADVLGVAHQTQGNFDISLIDCDNFFQLDLDKVEKHLKRWRKKYNNCIILAVHLYGHPVHIQKLKCLADKYNCKIVEDASQAHGALSDDEMVGSYADLCVYSLYPGKNLGAMGDAGIITTDNPDYYKKICELRNYGSPKKYHNNDIGWNNRLDPIQAVFLKHKLPHLDRWNLKRKEIANKYAEGINSSYVVTPKNAPHVTRNSYHIYPLLVDEREAIQNHLNERKVPTLIHYPIPPYKSAPFEGLKDRAEYFSGPPTNTDEFADKLLSLPMHPFLSNAQVEHIINAINSFRS
jgi:dTDP-4-amino-4,6-dideoxygalactose transaminase